MCTLANFATDTWCVNRFFKKPRINSVCFHEERGTQVQSFHYLEDSEVIWLHGFKPSGTDNTPVPIV
jgi:hypothetical protein